MQTSSSLMRVAAARSVPSTAITPCSSGSIFSAYGFSRENESMWKLPAPLALGFTLREKSSAQIRQRVLDDGRLETVVAHAPLAGVTTEMCLWFLENIDREVEFRGQRAIAYRFWHPRDHIYFKRLGKFGPGDTWHIVEAFGAERRWLLDDHFHVVQLDDSGFTMQVRVPLLGAAATAEERWQPS